MKKILFLLLFLPIMAVSQKPEDLVHSSTSYVDDYANLFTPKEEQALDANIRGFFNTAQISIVTVTNLDGLDVDTYANRLFRHFGVGSKSNNGVLILICIGEVRKLRVEVGYGLEGDLTDMKTAELIGNVKSVFKENRYYDATSELLGSIITQLTPASPEIVQAQEKALVEQEARNEADANAALLNVFFSILILTILSLISWLVYRLTTKKKRQLAAAVTEAEKVKNNMKVYRKVISNAILKEVPEASTALVLLNEAGLDPDQQFTSKSVADLYVQKYLIAEKKLNKAVEDVKNKVAILERISGLITGSPTLESMQNRFSEDQNLVKNLIFDETDYKPLLGQYGAMVLKYGEMLTKLKADYASKDYNLMQASTREFKELQNSIGTISQKLNSVQATDMDKRKKAREASTWAKSEIRRLGGYCNKDGVRNGTARATQARLSVVEDYVSKLNGDARNDYQWYLVISDELAKCTAAKKEHEAHLAYIAEQERIKREEEEAERRRLQRIRDEEEAAERRRREDDERRSSSYTTSYTSSWDDSSSSTFGGGSSGGGGSSSDI